MMTLILSALRLARKGVFFALAAFGPKNAVDEYRVDDFSLRA
jgi:hypothetical protein